MLAIFKRELRSCFHGMIGAVLTAFMLAATAIYFVALNLGYGLPRSATAAPTSCCSQARCQWAASCWANILPFASFLRCPALWMRA